jgi:transposase
MRYELSGYEWTAITPMLPNKPRGVRCVNDRRVLNGIFWVLRSGAPCRTVLSTRSKQCRLATRCDKLAANYLAFIKLASIRI